MRASYRLSDVPDIEDLQKILEHSEEWDSQETFLHKVSSEKYKRENRLKEVPSTPDLNKIERYTDNCNKSRRSNTREQKHTESVLEQEMLKYSVSKEKHRRRSFLDQNVSSYPEKSVQGIATAGAGALANMLGGGWHSTYIAASSTYTAVETAIRIVKHEAQDPYDEEMESEILSYQLDSE